MIDNKKIEEAAISKCGFISSEFYSGAKWMQEEFLQDLWHSANERPNNRSDEILLEFEDCDRLTTRISLYRLVDWQYFIENNKITRWLYIDDLIPKKNNFLL